MQLDCRFCLTHRSRTVAFADELIFATCLAQALIADGKVEGDVTIWEGDLMVALVTANGYLMLTSPAGDGEDSVVDLLRPAPRLEDLDHED